MVLNAPRPFRRWAPGLLLALALVGCGRGPGEGESYEGPAVESLPRAGVRLPDALQVRFEAVRGSGVSRESWEIEILQMGSEVRVRGSVRSPGTAIPVYRNMSPPEYTRFWSWLRRFPLDRVNATPAPESSERDWSKTLQLDIVLGPEQRVRSRNTWTRPLAPGNWVQDLEDHLHLMVLDYADEELERIRAESPTLPEEKPATREELLRQPEDPSRASGN